MNMFKNAGGFTLVELIVVIAILAILAGVAVPAYTGYISSANKAADDQLIEAVETAMSAALAMEGKNAEDADTYFVATFAGDKLTVTANSATTTETATKVWNNFKSFYGEDTCVVELDFYNTLTADQETTLPKLLDDVTVTAPAAGGNS